LTIVCFVIYGIIAAGSINSTKHVHIVFTDLERFTNFWRYEDTYQ